MRTNIVIDEELMEAAMRAGPFKTKKEALEAGLRLLARQAACRAILALRGQLRWQDAPKAASAIMAQPRSAHSAARAETARKARRAK